MEEIVFKKICTGCTACYTNCPVNAISMEENDEGFKYPVIDQDKCINCGMCKNTCPVLNTKKNDSINECYVSYSKDDKIKEKSSSGGIFPLVANEILDNNGIVIGAGFDEDNKLKHVAITKKEELDKLKSSKYLQSDLDDIFKFVKENLKSNIILFVGTPCQVAGLKAIVGNNDNLITIDLFCHGVPSPKLFDKYVNELERENGKLLNYIFKDKSTGWDTYSNTAIFEDKEKTELASQNSYMKLFFSHATLRESCYNCNFKLGNKYSDITLGDFWGVEKVYPEMYNKKGVSALIVNTKKGKKIFNNICNKMEYKGCKIDDIIQGNRALIKSVPRAKKRDSFYIDIDKYSIDELRKKYELVSKGPVSKGPGQIDKN